MHDTRVARLKKRNHETPWNSINNHMSKKEERWKYSLNEDDGERR